MFVDSREPVVCRRAALQRGFVQMALDVGDYSSEKVVFERKDLGDLVNSIFARYGDRPRLFEQMDKLFDDCQRLQRVPFLLVSGSLEAVERQFKERGQRLNRQAIYGAIASVVVRYDINIIWYERPFKELLDIMWSIAEKVEEGKLLLPQRRKLKEFSRSRSVASIANALQISPIVAERLTKKFGSLYNVLEAVKNHPSDVLVVEGIGKATFEKIKALGGIE